jgi:hypothetical protein
MLNNIKYRMTLVDAARRWVSNAGSYLHQPGIYGRPRQRCAENWKSYDGT